MTPEHESAFPLPPDLADVERYLRNVDTEAPAALLVRIAATRRKSMMRQHPERARLELLAGAISPALRVRRRLVALAALLTIVTLGLPWTAEAPKPSTASVRKDEAPSPFREDVARLLQPFPTSAHAQSAAAGKSSKAFRTTVPATALQRLTVDRRLFTRIRRDARGQEMSRTQREVSLDTLWFGAQMFWVLTTREALESPAEQQQVDSIALDANRLAPWNRRLRTPTFQREFSFMLGRVTISDSIGRARGCILQGTQPKLAPGYVSLRPCASKPWIYSAMTSHALDRRFTLALTEEHLALMLRAAPLALGWSATVVVPGPFAPLLPTFTSAEVTLRVVAIDTLAMVTGKTPCYRIELDYGARPDVWWISVATGEFVRGVRTTVDPATTETTTLERVAEIRR